MRLISTFILCCFLFSAQAQITAGPDPAPGNDCIPVPITLNYAGTVNGRSSYSYSGGGGNYLIYWTGASWEFTLDVGIVFLLSYNNANTLEPPCSNVFPWIAGPGCDFTQAPYIGGPSCSSIPMAIELIKFEATVTDRWVNLNWTTATEHDNSGFSIERSVGDLAHWQRLGFVKSNSNTTDETHYTFTDDAPAFGVSYYRLKTIDWAGKEEYSPATRAYMTQNEAIILSPNPVQTILKVASSPTDDAAFLLKIHDTTGRLISEQPYTETQLEVDMSALVSGLYFVEITADLRPIYRQVVIKT